jgi:hypothetical protein
MWRDDRKMAEAEAKQNQHSPETKTFQFKIIQCNFVSRAVFSAAVLYTRRTPE